jgi:hypothetical protein
MTLCLEPAVPGRLYAVPPVDAPVSLVCVKPAGHAGTHHAGYGVWWAA